MFKELLKTATRPKTNTLVGKEILPKTKYNEDIMTIHNEFYNASDKDKITQALEEAQAILTDCENADTQRMLRLKKIGFCNIPCIIEYYKCLNIRDGNKDKLELFEYWSNKYPNNNYITQQQVKAICEKYRLILGHVGYFKGYVPEKNQKDIESFNLKEEDIMVSCPESYGMYYSHLSKYLKTINSPEIREKARNNLLKRGVNDSCRTEQLQIVASQPDMYIPRDYEIKGHEIVSKDPIVLQPVKDGYLIVTAWGDEANDPIIKNNS